MFALTVSIVEPKNIKEAMADSAWIEAMQDELHQFDRLKVWELEEGIDFEESFTSCSLGSSSDFRCPRSTQVFSNLSDGRENAHLYWTTEGKMVYVAQRKGSLIQTNLDYRSKNGSLMYLASSSPGLSASSMLLCTLFKLMTKLQSTKEHFRRSIMPAPDTGKDSGGIQFLGDKLVSWMSRNNKHCMQCLQQRHEYVALSASVLNHKVVRLGINPMIQPEPEDLPKDNPKFEIAVLRSEELKGNVWDKGCKQEASTQLRRETDQYICCQNHKLIADIENDIMDPVAICSSLRVLKPTNALIESKQRSIQILVRTHSFQTLVELIRFQAGIKESYAISLVFAEHSALIFSIS
ncbi:hypothetical protein Tco_0876552 [Tanacetum coccineum]|uniref:Gag-Pol polyprotein n=1 Tax=Tanacetum coccineum TaxID=301880 RepID=A0ABQ5BSV6_9ASTR